MSDQSKPSVTDLAGLAPLAKSVEIVTQATVDMATALIERICFPAAKEFGLLLKEKVHAYRAKNITTMVEKAGAKMKENEVTEDMHASPRVVNTIIDNSAWIDDSVVQDLWAGLLSSSCTHDGDDDSNLIFTNLLGSLTKMQARLLRAACELSTKVIEGGFVHANHVVIQLEGVFQITGDDDLQRLDRELDHLRSLSLIDENLGGIWGHDRGKVNLTPTPLALHMYVRCQGSRKSPAEFFSATHPPTQN